MAKAKKKVAKKKAAPKKAVKKKVVKKVIKKKVVAKKKVAKKKVVAKKAAPKKVVKKVVAKKVVAKKPATPKGSYRKSDIVDHLAFSLDVTKKTASTFLDELVGLVAKNAKKDFTIPGLGKFFVQKYKKRNGRNPATGKAMVIPAKTKVRFRVGKALQDAVYPPK
ncbi:MAG: HU family DNA-binding protein [Melioribacteraceae bacterium]